MCGITGFWRLSRPDGSEGAQLDAMMRQLTHRGPDGMGRHLDAARGLAMGHTRLSIIGLETGAQPLTRGKDLVLTVNGEFYDYKPIRASLVRGGAHFQSKSDSEIALPLYRRHGLDFVHHLRGEFAIALFDASRNRLVLVRDRFGVKPLHVHIKDRAVYWGSEIKSLLVNPDVPGELDAKAAMGQMMNLMLPGQTAFSEIAKVRPGHMMVIEKHGEHLQVAQHKYWDLDFPPEEEYGDSSDAVAHTEAVAEGLQDAVRTRLEADVPVGCYLSGGIDSCSILGLAGALQQSPVKAFTISFDHHAYDEAEPAKEMARSVNADQEILSLDSTDLYGDSYVEAVRHAERAFYNPFSVAKWHLSRRVRDSGYRVVVTGEGSDELFAGYPFFKQDLLRHGTPQQRAALGNVAQDNAIFRGATISEEALDHPELTRVCGFTPAWIQPWMTTLKRARPLLADDVLEDLNGYEPVGLLADTLDATRLDGRHVLDKAQYTYAKTLMESQVLGWSGDRMDMAHSMEARPAFLDHKLAERATLVPPPLRIRNGVEKWILREAMKGLLPESLYKRPKFAFMAPPSHVDQSKRTAVRGLCDRYLSGENIRRVGLFDPARVDGFIRQAANQDDQTECVRNDVILNHLLGLHILHAELLTPCRAASRAA